MVLSREVIVDRDVGCVEFEELGRLPPVTQCVVDGTPPFDELGLRERGVDERDAEGAACRLQVRIIQML